MKKKYKHYTVVDSAGLKNELSQAYLNSNDDLYEFLEKRHLLIVNKKMKVDEVSFSFMKDKTYSEFVEQNKSTKKNAYEYIHIIEVYGNMVLVESSSDYGSESFIDRIEVNDVVKMVYNGTLNVKNPTKLKGYIGFKEELNNKK
jgi:hypothetical protein